MQLNLTIVVADVTSDAASIFSDVTSFGGSVASDATSGACFPNLMQALGRSHHFPQPEL